MLVMNINDADQAIRLGLVDKKLLKKYGKDVLQTWIDQVNEDQYDHTTVEEDGEEIDLDFRGEEFDSIVLRGHRDDY